MKPLCDKKALIICGANYDIVSARSLERAFTLITEFKTILAKHYQIGKDEAAIKIVSASEITRCNRNYEAVLVILFSDLISEITRVISGARLGYFGESSKKSPIVILSFLDERNFITYKNKILMAQGSFINIPFELKTIKKALKTAVTLTMDNPNELDYAARISMGILILERMFHGDTISAQRYWNQVKPTIEYFKQTNIAALQKIVTLPWWKSLDEDMQELSETILPLQLSFDLHSLRSEVGSLLTNYRGIVSLIKRSVSLDRIVVSSLQEILMILSSLEQSLNRLRNLRDDLKKYQ